MNRWRTMSASCGVQTSTQALPRGAEDRRFERIKQFQELLAAFDHALVVKGHIEIGLFVPNLADAGLELVKVAPGISVVGTEPAEIDVGKEKTRHRKSESRCGHGYGPADERPQLSHRQGRTHRRR